MQEKTLFRIPFQYCLFLLQIPVVHLRGRDVAEPDAVGLGTGVIVDFPFILIQLVELLHEALHFPERFPVCRGRLPDKKDAPGYRVVIVIQA